MLLDIPYIRAVVQSKALGKSGKLLCIVGGGVVVVNEPCLVCLGCRKDCLGSQQKGHTLRTDSGLEGCKSSPAGREVEFALSEAENGLLGCNSKVEGQHDFPATTVRCTIHGGEGPARQRTNAIEKADHAQGHFARFIGAFDLMEFAQVPPRDEGVAGIRSGKNEHSQRFVLFGRRNLLLKCIHEGKIDSVACFGPVYTQCPYMVASVGEQDHQPASTCSRIQARKSSLPSSHATGMDRMQGTS